MFHVELKSFRLEFYKENLGFYWVWVLSSSSSCGFFFRSSSSSCGFFFRSSSCKRFSCGGHWFELILWNWMECQLWFWGFVCNHWRVRWILLLLLLLHVDFPSFVSSSSSFPSSFSGSSSSPTLYRTRVFKTWVPCGLLVHINFTELEPHTLEMLYS